MTIPAPRTSPETVRAAAPRRGMTKLNVNLGTLIVPLTMYSGAEESAVRRTGLQRANGNPSQYVRINPETGAILSAEEIAFCVEAPSGTWVEVTNDDVQAASRDGLDGEIVYVVPLKLLFNGTLSSEKPYQLRPTQITKGKSKAADPAAIAVYSLLLKGLAELRAAAIIRFSSRERVKYGALQPDGSFLALRFDEEVRQTLPLVLHDSHDPASVKMMTQLLSTRLTDQPVLHDTLAERITTLVSERATAAGAGTPIVLQPVGVKGPAVETDGPAGLDVDAMLRAALAGVSG